ncbi:Uncharacterized mitochondrial protein AtMg00310 [Linum grandiflorum]
MSMFKFSDGLCRRLNRQVARFWWGATATTKRIHWKSWDLLCQPKLQDGLGFWDFRSINQSLLAALCWRILHSPDSLATRLLRGRYVPNRDLLSATKGSAPSWAWSGLLYGCKLLLHGGRWLVGDGLSIPTLSPWLPGDSPILCVLPTTRPIPPYVNGLLLHGQWNQSTLQELFDPTTFSRINSIPLPLSPISDSWVWKLSRNGKYSAASGYRLSYNLRRQVTTSAYGPELLNSELWAKVWSSPIQPKLRFFMWKLFHGVLPTSVALADRHMPIPRLCSVCFLDGETIDHLFLSCPVALKLGAEKNCTNFIQPGVHPVNLWRRVNSACPSTSAKLVYFWWRIWKSRNAVVFEGFQHSISALARHFHLHWNEALNSAVRRPTHSSSIVPDVPRNISGAPLLSRYD